MGSTENASSGSQRQDVIASAERLHYLDTLKGLLITSCVLFHLCYDLSYIEGIYLPWFEGLAQELWRYSIAWPFIFIAGCAYNRSHNNLLRAGRYLAIALLIFGATSLTGVVSPISFGIIFCMGACTLATYLLERLHLLPKKPSYAAIFSLIFLLIHKLHWGFIGIGPIRYSLPAALFQSPYLAWLGFPGPDFYSSDYWPLLPHLFLFLAGVSLGKSLQTNGQERRIKGLQCAPLELLGRNTLLIYLVHQPIIIIVLFVLHELALM